jgi:hypothetical protein
VKRHEFLDRLDSLNVWKRASTLGALCMAAAHPSVDTRDLFNKLMAWGLSMTVVGGLVSWLLFSVLGIGV